MNNAQNRRGITHTTSDNTQHNTNTSPEEYIPDAEVVRAREAANPLAHATSLGDEVDSLVNAKVRRGMSKNQLAARTWYQCNGDLERRHTTGVYLRPGRSRQSAPVLGVYVDNHACLNDFSMRKDIYLSRLAFAGLDLSGIEFRLSRQEYIDRRPKAGAKGPKKEKPVLLEPLNKEEEQTAQELVSHLSPSVPQSLKSRVSKVVELSLSREKAKRRQK